MHIQSSFCAGLSQDGSIFQAERDHVQSMVDGSLIFSFGTKRPAHARSHEKDICPELTAPHARSRPLTPVSCHVSLPLCVFLKDVSGEMLIFRPVQKNAVLGNIMIFSLTEVYFLGFSWCIKDHANTVTRPMVLASLTTLSSPPRPATGLALCPGATPRITIPRA